MAYKLRPMAELEELVRAGGFNSDVFLVTENGHLTVGCPSLDDELDENGQKVKVFDIWPVGFDYRGSHGLTADNHGHSVDEPFFAMGVEFVGWCLFPEATDFEAP